MQWLWAQFSRTDMFNHPGVDWEGLVSEDCLSRKCLHWRYDQSSQSAPSTRV